MSWYRVLIRDGLVSSCDLVEAVEPGSTEVMYIEAETAEAASQVALLLSRRRKRVRQNKGPSGKGGEAVVQNTNRLETLEEVAKAWSDAETPSQFVRWLVSEITRLKGAQTPAERSLVSSSLGGAGVSF